MRLKTFDGSPTHTSAAKARRANQTTMRSGLRAQAVLCGYWPVIGEGEQSHLQSSPRCAGCRRYSSHRAGEVGDAIRPATVVAPESAEASRYCSLAPRRHAAPYNIKIRSSPLPTHPSTVHELQLYSRTGARTGRGTDRTLGAGAALAREAHPTLRLASVGPRRSLSCTVPTLSLTVGPWAFSMQQHRPRRRAVQIPRQPPPLLCLPPRPRSRLPTQVRTRVASSRWRRRGRSGSRRRRRQLLRLASSTVS